MRDEHGHRLAEHRRLGFDPADAPTEYAEAVDHRCVRIGADKRVGIGDRRSFDASGNLVGCEHHAHQIFQIDLMNDPGVRRHDAEVLKRVLSPAQERVALLIPLKLSFGVDSERVRRAGLVNLHRVIDDQFDRLERVDFFGIAAQSFHGVAHRREIDDRGHAGEVLEQNPARSKGDFLARFRLRVPLNKRLDVVDRDGDSVLVAQKVFQKHLERERQPTRIESFFLQGVESKKAQASPGNFQVGQRAEAVQHRISNLSIKASSQSQDARPLQLAADRRSFDFLYLP